jgi:hypothetical protein
MDNYLCRVARGRTQTNFRQPHFEPVSTLRLRMRSSITPPGGGKEVDKHSVDQNRAGFGSAAQMKVALGALLLSLFSIGSLKAQVVQRETQNKVRINVADEEDDDWIDILPIKGPVRTLRIEEATIENRFGKLVEAYRHPLVLAVFNAKGKKIEETTYFGAGHPSYSTSFYTYDAKGNRIKKVVVLPPSRVVFYPGKIIRDEPGSKDVTTYSYSTKGTLVAKTVSTGGRLTKKNLYDYTYDTNGRVVLAEASDYGPDGSLSGKTVCAYDVNEQLAQVSRYAGDGKLSDKVMYAYDLKGNLTEVSTYGPQGEVLEKETYTYDLNARLIEFAKYLRGTLWYKRTSSYDGEGNLIEQTVQLASENRNLSTSSSTLPVERSTFRYRFDRTGNWVKRYEGKQVTKFGKTYFEPRLVTLRIITYY